MLRTLDRSLNDLLDLLGNPAESEPWKRRGLVVGDVQSGKTATYTGLITKASDAGYRVIILLTGTLENVRRQTQKRLDSGFVGFDSREYLSTARAQLRGESAWAGLGWVYDEELGGLFVEHHSGSQESVEELIDLSLEDMARRRGLDFGPANRVVAGAHCEDRPVCALAIATYEVESWQAARG